MPAAQHTHEGHHDDQRPRRGFSQGQPIHHLGRTEPAETLHGTLGHVGQHGIGPAEAHQGHAAEEAGHGGQGAVPALQQGEQAEGQGHGSSTDQQGEGQLPGPDAGVGRCGRVIAVERIELRRRPRWGSGHQDARSQPLSDPAAERRQGDQQGLGQAESLQSQQGGGGDHHS